MLSVRKLPDGKIGEENLKADATMLKKMAHKITHKMDEMHNKNRRYQTENSKGRFAKAV
jgi:t-SNARE complex subunit (syntaxin)